MKKEITKAFNVFLDGLCCLILVKSLIICKYIAFFLAYKALPRLYMYFYVFLCHSSMLNMALLLASIILDAKHEKSVMKNSVHLKLSSNSRQKLSDIGYTVNI